MFLKLVIAIVLLDIAKTTSFETQYMLFGLALLLLSFQVINNKPIDKKIILLFIGWLAVNFAAAQILGNINPRLLVVRFGINYLLLPSLILNLYSKKFLDVLELSVFYLTLISLPLFAGNILFKPAYDALQPIFEGVTNPNLSDLNYWSGIIYVNAIEQSYGNLNLLRNCGFMWEPGYFALMIIFAMGYRWLTRGIKLDLYFTIYTVALLTTYSTAGYFAYFVLISACFLKSTSLLRVSLFVGMLLVFFYFVYSLEFMSGKINLYVDAIEANQFNYALEYRAIKLNRFQIALYDVSRVARYPFGFGINERFSFDGVSVVGTNGLTGIMRMWGLPFFFYFIWLLYKYHKIINIAGLSFQSVMLILTSLLLVFFSQSVQFNMLTYIIITIPLSYQLKQSLWQIKSELQ